MSIDSFDEMKFMEELERERPPVEPVDALGIVVQAAESADRMHAIYDRSPPSSKPVQYASWGYEEEEEDDSEWKVVDDFDPRIWHSLLSAKKYPLSGIRVALREAVDYDELDRRNMRFAMNNLVVRVEQELKEAGLLWGVEVVAPYVALFIALGDDKMVDEMDLEDLVADYARLPWIPYDIVKFMAWLFGVREWDPADNAFGAVVTKLGEYDMGRRFIPIAGPKKSTFWHWFTTGKGSNGS